MTRELSKAPNMKVRETLRRKKRKKQAWRLFKRKKISENLLLILKGQSKKQFHP